MNNKPSRPWLSIVMPVHQPNQWLDDALASIEDDGRDGGIELIIRDSTPDFPAGAVFVRQHRERLRIDYDHMPHIASWTRKTNLGVEEARGEHVCTLHQDDVWLPDRIQIIRNMIDNYPDAALYLTPARLIDHASRDLGGWRPPFPLGEVAQAAFRDLLLVQNSIAMPAPVFKRAAYIAAGGLDESLWYTPDWELWLKLGEQGPVVFDPRPTSAFRIHGGAQTMTRSRSEFAEQLGIVLDRHLTADTPTARISRASVAINTALAEAAAGDASAKWRALGSFAKLGPVDAVRYLKYSRLIERLWPRLRLRFAGGL
ncbi:glycosyltransferase [Altererythrobacter sp. GH1-8]|uniref:glycosyltransferase n=1 Tax=Altererythrobacter sp. GH1-8 TaxID=3349333 RepID=UPI00374D3364